MDAFTRRAPRGEAAKRRQAPRLTRISTLKVGDKVKVAGTKQADGSFTETRIDLIPTTPPSGEYPFEGAIEQIASDGKKIVVNGDRAGRFQPLLETRLGSLHSKVYIADPLTSPKCGGTLRIISFIEDRPVIEKILRHLMLWDPPERPPPPRCSRTLEPGADFLAWEATGRMLDGID